MARDRDRSRRDRAGVGPDPTPRHRLVPLDELDGYGIRDGEPDIRGWDVRTLAGRDLGAVEDLLVDPERGEVVMIEVELRGDGIHAEIPIRSVQLDRDRKCVLVDSADVEGTRNDVRARDRLGDDERDRLRETWGGSTRSVRYGEREVHGDDDVEEIVVERRPVVEEVVVRRRKVDD